MQNATFELTIKIVNFGLFYGFFYQHFYEISSNCERILLEIMVKNEIYKIKNYLY